MLKMTNYIESVSETGITFCTLAANIMYIINYGLKLLIPFLSLKRDLERSQNDFVLISFYNGI